MPSQYASTIMIRYINSGSNFATFLAAKTKPISDLWTLSKSTCIWTISQSNNHQICIAPFHNCAHGQTTIKQINCEYKLRFYILENKALPPTLFLQLLYISFIRRYLKASFRIQSTPPRTPVARHKLAFVAAAWKPSVAKLQLLKKIKYNNYISSVAKLQLLKKIKENNYIQCFSVILKVSQQAHFKTQFLLI